MIYIFLLQLSLGLGLTYFGYKVRTKISNLVMILGIFQLIATLAAFL